MTRKNLSKTNKIKLFSVLFPVFAILILSSIIASRASASCTTADGVTTCTNSTTFDVNVSEVLTVSITRPDTWASGSVNTLLINKIGVSVISNNPAGFTASMKSASAVPNLVNQADSSFVIPTLSQTTAVDDIVANSWGYGIVTAGGAAPTSYSGMVGSNDTPIEVVSTTTASGAVSRDIYFAAKADSTIASGTYSDSIIISVVSGVITDVNDEPNDNPISPVNPITPATDTNQTDNVATVITNTTVGNSPTGNISVMTTTSTDTSVTPNTTTTTTEFYAKPAGVSTTTPSEGTPLATGLAITAGVSAAAGVALFALARAHSFSSVGDNGKEGY